MHHACGAREHDSDTVQRGGRRVFPAGLDWVWRRWQCNKHGSIQPPAVIVRATADRAAPTEPATEPPPTEPPPTGQIVDHGRYVGTVTIDGVNYFGMRYLRRVGKPTFTSVVRTPTTGRFSWLRQKARLILSALSELRQDIQSPEGLSVATEGAAANLGRRAPAGVAELPLHR